MLQLFSTPDKRTPSTIKDKKYCPIGVHLIGIPLYIILKV